MTKARQVLQQAARPALGTAAAWARTDFQALCVAEAYNAGVLGRAVALAISAPTEQERLEFATEAWPHIRAQSSSEFRVGWIAERTGATWVHHQRADRRVITDLWDPHTQRILADAINSPHPRGGVVLAIEGSSVLSFADLILGSSRLPTSHTTLAGRLRWLAEAQRLCLVSSTLLPNSTEKGLVDAGVRVEGHAFEWLGSLRPQNACFEPNVLIAPEYRQDQNAESLENGMRELVANLALEGPLRYISAGWESPELIYEWQRSEVVNVSRGTQWLGPSLRALRQNQTVNVVNDRNLAVWKAVTNAAGAEWINHFVAVKPR
ncbi:hypothetical protein HD598_001517 [Neomicrococcus aestuarii]|uniref:Uncharacterized protein n=1 Tax=Neomicrococcus aestuarii TaxID=556325 RepID=A0A7W8TVF0_9MICC|nr:hypothetical protein [Neomicrococcus aestuarii]MBB5512830.1 hypothetical protein [Neomicrococcus aestuarii]